MGLFKKYKCVREAQILGENVLKVLRHFPTVETAWSDHMMPLILEGAYSNTEELSKLWLEDLSMPIGATMPSPMGPPPLQGNVPYQDPAAVPAMPPLQNIKRQAETEKASQAAQLAALQKVQQMAMGLQKQLEMLQKSNQPPFNIDTGKAVLTDFTQKLTQLIQEFQPQAGPQAGPPDAEPPMAPPQPMG
jgi:hypothetical protein